VTGSDFWRKVTSSRGVTSSLVTSAHRPLLESVTLLLSHFDARAACGRAGAPNTYLSLRNDAQQPYAQRRCADARVVSKRRRARTRKTQDEAKPSKERIGPGLSLPRTSQTPNPSLPSCFVTSRARQSGDGIYPHASLRPRK
jgi:hypothetical protein